MALVSRAGLGRAPQFALAAAYNASRLNLYPVVASGVSGTMSGTPGTITVTPGITFDTDYLVFFSRATTGGTLGHLSCPVSTVGASSGTTFTVNSSANESSTLFWQLVMPCFHADVTGTTSGDFTSPVFTPLTVATTTPSLLSDVITRCQQLDFVYRAHLADTVAHQKADTVNVPVPAISTVVDQGTVNTYLNALQASLNAHNTQSGVHYINDGKTNSTTAASSLSTSKTLVVSLASTLNAHMGRAPVGQALVLGAD